MARTLITVTPVNTAAEEQLRADELTCSYLTQQAGPWPIAKITETGTVAYLLKLYQEADRLLISPVIDGTVMAAVYCYKIDDPKKPVELEITKDTMIAGQFNLTLRPPSAAKFLHQTKMQLNRNNSGQVVSPLPSLQVGVIRTSYGTPSVDTALEFIGTVDTRPGRALAVYGKIVKVWLDGDWAVYEWNTL